MVGNYNKHGFIREVTNKCFCFYFILFLLFPQRMIDWKSFNDSESDSIINIFKSKEWFWISSVSF